MHLIQLTACKGIPVRITLSPPTPHSSAQSHLTLPCPLLSTHLHQLAPSLKMDSVAYSPFVGSLSWLLANKGVAAANDLGGQMRTCVCMCVCLFVLSLCLCRHPWWHTAPCWCARAAQVTTLYVDTTAYYMHLTSPHGWTLLPGINHVDLWQLNPVEVIHGAASVTFHSGTQLGPSAQCAHSWLWWDTYSCITYTYMYVQYSKSNNEHRCTHDV